MIGVTHYLVLSACHGGLILSDECIKEIEMLKGHKINIRKLYRWDTDLIKVVKRLGVKRSSGNIYGFSTPVKIVDFILKVGEAHTVMQYDGLETLYIFNEKTREIIRTK